MKTMHRRRMVAILTLGTLALLAPTDRARGELCTIDAVPAATLLIPYFAVDLAACDADEGLNTVFTVTNASAAPTIAHVVFWTDWSVPALDFDLYLTGYDVQVVNLRDIFCDGFLAGTVSQPGIANADLDSTTLAHLQAWFTGEASPATNNCAGSPRGNDTAIGYVTVDNFTANVSGSPANGASYFNNISFQNQLWGTWYLETFKTTEITTATKEVCEECTGLKGKQKRRCKRRRRKCRKCPGIVETTTPVVTSNGLSGAPVVHIEAASGGILMSGTHTFYGRYLGGSAADRREPLGTAYGVEYSQVADPADFDLIVWREASSSSSAVSCGSSPSWFPLGFSNTSGTGPLIAFDQQENPVAFTRILNKETQRYESFLEGLPFTDGWMYLNFQSNSVSSTYSDNFAQAWVHRVREDRLDASGVLQFDTACSTASFTATPGGPVITNP